MSRNECLLPFVLLLNFLPELISKNILGHSLRQSAGNIHCLYLEQQSKIFLYVFLAHIYCDGMLAYLQMSVNLLDKLSNKKK